MNVETLVRLNVLGCIDCYDFRAVGCGCLYGLLICPLSLKLPQARYHNEANDDQGWPEVQAVAPARPSSSPGVEKTSRGFPLD